ncbi:MAG: hypothetical protein U0354_20380 [Candidatus Sericytochromatia bacterium]
MWKDWHKLATLLSDLSVKFIITTRKKMIGIVIILQDFIKNN